MSTDHGEALYEVPSGVVRGWVQVKGIRLNYWRIGEPRRPDEGMKPVLLVLHGATDWGLDWARFARRAADRLDCILLDQRGHGYSDKPAEGYTDAQMADDAGQALHALGIGRAAVLGHSMGGGIALALAATYAPVVERLVLVDPAVRIPVTTGPTGQESPSGRPRASAEQRRAGHVANQALGREGLNAKIQEANPTWNAEDVAHTAESTLLVSPHFFTDTPRTTPGQQEDQLRRLACPTLLVRGDPDRGSIISEAAARRIEGLAPRDLLRITTIAGTGHVPQRQAFDLFVHVVLGFLTGEATPDVDGGTPACFAHLLDEEGRIGS